MSNVMTKSERETFLSEVRVGVISVAARGRGPIAVPIWYAYEPGGALKFCTNKDSLKAQLLEESGRCTMCVQDENPPYRYVSVEGPISSIEKCDHDQDLGPIARRYLGERAGNQYIEDTRGEAEEVFISVEPEHWSAVDYGRESSQT
jgi:nitroimidazol reductase NimA-like FMN-containing flavoprotein (pyridoxamine 5'-phosphate oxidase superfamily)